jgi:phage terminase large subunit
MNNEFEFPEKLGFLLFESARWKVAYGGRGSGKTENGARALLMLARTKCMRILCGREIQNSINDSSKFTLEANIEDLGLQDEFQILSTEIIHKKTSSRFFFKGLRHNINSIKSLGRIDIVWIDEADKLSKTVLDKLSPTIRGRSNFEEDRGGPFGVGPEIWLFYNPDLDTDEVYIRTVVEKDKYLPDYVYVDDKGEPLLNKNGSLAIDSTDTAYFKVRYAIVSKIAYWDNKWFPPDLRMEMNVLKAANKNKYLEVWEGNTKVVLEGAIYAEELREVLSSGRRGRVPYDSTRPVFTAWDLGHSDKTAIWFVQRVGLEYNLIDYEEDQLKKMPYYIKLLQDKGYTYATHYLPHDASAETLSNVTPEKQLKSVGYSVKVVERPSRKMVAINAVRTILPMCNFDEQNTSEGWQCLSRYAYKVDLQTGVFSKEPEHDTPWSHGADGLTTLALSLKSEQASKKPDRDRARVVSMPRQGSWMRGA